MKLKQMISVTTLLVFVILTVVTSNANLNVYQTVSEEYTINATPCVVYLETGVSQGYPEGTFEVNKASILLARFGSKVYYWGKKGKGKIVAVDRDLTEDVSSLGVYKITVEKLIAQNKVGGTDAIQSNKKSLNVIVVNSNIKDFDQFKAYFQNIKNYFFKVSPMKEYQKNIGFYYLFNKYANNNSYNTKSQAVKRREEVITTYIREMTQKGKRIDGEFVVVFLHLGTIDYDAPAVSYQESRTMLLTAQQYPAETFVHEFGHAVAGLPDEYLLQPSERSTCIMNDPYNTGFYDKDCLRKMNNAFLNMGIGQ